MGLCLYWTKTVSGCQGGGEARCEESASGDVGEGPRAGVPGVGAADWGPCSLDGSGWGAPVWGGTGGAGYPGRVVPVRRGKMATAGAAPRDGGWRGSCVAQLEIRSAGGEGAAFQGLHREGRVVGGGLPEKPRRPPHAQLEGCPPPPFCERLTQCLIAAFMSHPRAEWGGSAGGRLAARSARRARGRCREVGGGFGRQQTKAAMWMRPHFCLPFPEVPGSSVPLQPRV